MRVILTFAIAAGTLTIGVGFFFIGRIFHERLKELRANEILPGGKG